MPQITNPFALDSPLHAIMATLLARPTPPLVPEKAWDSSLTAQIAQAAKAAKTSIYVQAALHLLNDDLDNAHKLVQQNEGNQTADYLHMLVHRREGDWSNTGYWVRRVGTHPIYATLSDAMEPAGSWDPSNMVTLCRQASQNKPDTETAEEIARLSAWETAAAVGWCVRNPA